MLNPLRYCELALFCLLPIAALAAPERRTELQQCLMDSLQGAADEVTVGELRELCAAKAAPANGVVTERIVDERLIERQRFTITPHRLNYVLPVAHTSAINRQPLAQVDDVAASFDDTEIKYQISLKFPVAPNNLLIRGDALYGAFTLNSFWQAYASDISEPFRETNYRPEIFYLAPLPWRPFGGGTGFMVGIEHQSNGQVSEVSRSWNRGFGEIMFERGGFATSLRAWQRINVSDEDDNPDITDFMGHMEWNAGFQFGDGLEVELMARKNVSTNKGAAEIGVIFPLYGRLRGYVHYFDGYGESLIDYDHRQRRIGIGFALGDLL